MSAVRRLGAACLAGVLGLLLAGCGGLLPLPGGSGVASPSSAPPTPGLPPRPVQLPVAGLDPCALLTPAQQQRLGVHQISLAAGQGDNDGLDCSWNNDPRKPEDSYAVGVNTVHGAEWVLGSDSPREIVQVEGLFAVQTAGGLADPDEQCSLWIDVAAGQSLEVSYENHYGKDPAMNRRLACRKAHDAAVAVLATVRALAR